jgi:hypothetical protein
MDSVMDSEQVLTLMLMYLILPVWLLAGFADYLCHRTSNIEQTSGWKESVLHLLQFAEMAVPILVALFLKITTGVLILMLACLILHQATAMWDVAYAHKRREIRPIEQHVHSLLEVLPLTALLMVAALHWDATLGLINPRAADFSFVLKEILPDWRYIGAILAIALLFEILPYTEELMRGLRFAKKDKS